MQPGEKCIVLLSDKLAEHYGFCTIYAIYIGQFKELDLVEVQYLDLDNRDKLGLVRLHSSENVIPLSDKTKYQQALHRYFLKVCGVW